ncbi:MAG: hypothetical protein L3J04_04000 [Robiginitomaculum sp.]|nr:hypothetical protein [Robiginitomaculum sp.]
MAMFDPLFDHLETLQKQKRTRWSTTYAGVEQIIGQKFYESARKYSAYWKWGSSPEGGGVRRCLQMAQWKTAEQSPNSEQLTFVFVGDVGHG